MIKELDLGGFSLAGKKENKQKTDANHPLRSPVGSLDRSYRVVVLLGKSGRRGTVRFLSLCL